MNGTMAQGGSQTHQQINNGITNGAPGHPEHGRKPSVVINASGAYGTTSNGGPVAPNVVRAGINFGSTNQAGPDAPVNPPFQAQHSSLPAPRNDPRTISPAHSPSPIPQPQASGGRPPSIHSQNMPNFGSLPPDGDMSRGTPGAPGQLNQMPMHERRASSQSTQSEISNQGVSPSFNRSGNMMPPGAGRGRNFAPQQQFVPSPSQHYRQIPGQQPRNAMPQYPQQAPGSPFARNRASPVPMAVTPQMGQQQMGGNPPMQYGGYPQHLGPQHQMYGMQGYDPNAGYYQPYMYGQYPGPQPSSPRPQSFQSPYPGGPGQMQPPYGPPSTPGMVRTSSQASEHRPPSSLGQSQTPVQSGSIPPPVSASQSSNFVRPTKTNKAIIIKDANGNPIDLKKPSTPASQPASQAPLIVNTPGAPTPPPRTPSAAMTSEETKASFAEQVKRKKEEEDAKAKQQAESAKPAESAATAAPAVDPVKKAAVEAEKAAAVAADDEKGVKDADAAAKGMEKPAEEVTAKEETEDERIEREIAEMEAAEREEEEREKAFQEKKRKEREAAAKIAAAKLDEDLKRQEREAEEREEQRDRERQTENKAEDTEDDESKALFAKLARPAFGPGASAPESGAETPASEDTPSEAGVETNAANAQAGRAAAQKPKPIPHPLKLDTNKQIERAEPTPGMQALKSARFLTVKESPSYPKDIKSPNPALNPAATRKGRAYDKDFLMQFQQVFKEKPSVDWDQKVRETLGPGGDDRPQSARTPSSSTPRGGVGGRPAANALPNFGGVMGNFGGMARGTTSQDRFAAATMGVPARTGMPGMVRVPSQLGMGGAGAGMSRQNSVQMMSNMGLAGSPRQVSSRGGRDRSKREDRSKSKKEEEALAAKMPLTAHIEIAPLQQSGSGWKATSLGPTANAAGPDPSGLMAPDLVQRKVKAALNKMTPEKFDKISDQILEIAAQSRNESDGRTLRQVIQLTFEKACDEAHWAGMYAQFCHKMLTAMSPEIRDETINDKNGNPVVGGALFRKYLLNRCQEEFERGWQADLPEKPEGETQEAALLSDDYYVAAAAKRRGLGLIQFIGQLYRLRMLTLRIMHECVVRLLNFKGEPDEASIENLTTLLKVIGATMEEDEQGRNSIAMYFQRIEEVILKSNALPSRPRFMIMDLIDLRKAGWKGKDDSKGPKTIQQIHEEAEAARAKEEAERQRQHQRGGAGGRMPQGRGDARNFSGNVPPPQDFNRTNVAMDDLKRLQNRGSRPQSGVGLGPGGGLNTLGPRTSSRRGLGPGSGNTTRGSTPPVDSKKEEPTQQNAFSALAALDPSGEAVEPTVEAASPPASRGAADKDEDSTNA